MWEWFQHLIFDIIAFFFGFVHDWGLAILIVTLIFRLLLFPIMQKQIKSSYTMQKFSPKLQELQTKYANDQQRLAQETQKLYAESGFNPIAGCLPMLLQMPIFIALFQVLTDLPRFTEYTNFSFYWILPDLTLSPGTVLGTQGFVASIPYFIILLIFALCTFLPSLLMAQGQGAQQRKQQMLMMVIMSCVMLFIGYQSPAGVLLFWGMSSLFGVFQQQITTRVLRKEDSEKEQLVAETKPVEVDVTRKVKKKRPTKKR